MTTIKIKLNDREIELTTEEAQKVYQELAGLLGTVTEKEYIDRPYPVYPYSPPIYPQPTWVPPWTITCHSGTHYQ